MHFAQKVPFALTALRALLAPVVILLAWMAPNPVAFGVCLSVAFLSDIFDGIIARRLGVATADLRRFDSAADSVFYLAATGAAWLLYPDVIRHQWVALAALGILELVRYIVDLAKFGREASYHMWSSKAWGIFLFVGFFCLLALGQKGILVVLPIYLGLVTDAEGLLISSVLPEWQSDVPSIVHAMRIRATKRRAWETEVPEPCDP